LLIIVTGLVSDTSKSELGASANIVSLAPLVAERPAISHALIPFDLMMANEYCEERASVVAPLIVSEPERVRVTALAPESVLM